MNKRPFLLGICGPTASGKTALSIRLCQEIGGEVVSADSMQLYEGMDIGTAKPTTEEMAGVPHHLIGIAHPNERYSAAAYREKAIPAIEEIFARGHQPVLCGGTGLYIDALTKPMRFAAQDDGAYRAQLEAEALQLGGKEALHALLHEVDAESAARLHVNDVRRVIRALEIYHITGKTMTEWNRLDAQREGDYQIALFAIQWPRDVLYQRIDKRVDIMVENGLIEEVQALLNAGMDRHTTAMQALGYKEIVMALDGQISMEEAIDRIKQGSRNYAKRQITWFGRDERVHWLPAEQKIDDMVQEILKQTEVWNTSVC